jgi:hypothetical protein
MRGSGVIGSGFSVQRFKGLLLSLPSYSVLVFDKIQIYDREDWKQDRWSDFSKTLNL